MTPNHLPIELAQLASDVARQAGDLARRGRRSGPGEISTKSTATDMVTEFDRASEAMIVARLRADRPADGLVGEEGASSTGSTGIDWLIDPIDGTTNFMYDLPAWAVSVGAVDAAGPLAGAVYLPVLDEMYVAWRGGGASCNGEPIRCSTTADTAVALVATGFNYHADRRRRQAADMATLIADVRDIRRCGSAATDLCWVACGRVDAYYEQWLNPWDTAAGTIIAQEAGAVVGTYPARAGEPAGLLAAPAGLFEPMRRLIERALAATSAE